MVFYYHNNNYNDHLWSIAQYYCEPGSASFPRSPLSHVIFLSGLHGRYWYQLHFHMFLYVRTLRSNESL